MSTAYQEYPTEDDVPVPKPAPAKAQADADKAARLAAARARAEAARAAVERRRQSEVQMPGSEDTYPTEDAAPAPAKTRAVPAADTYPTEEGTYPTEDAAPAPAKTRAVPAADTYPTEEGTYPTEDAAPAPAKARAIPAPEVDLAAEMARIEQESEALKASESTLEQRLQWYSEVVGLRKELAVVKEDEDKLRKQLAETESAAAAHNPQVDQELTMLEDEAQQSPLQHAWAEACQAYNPDEQDGETLDISNLPERLRAAQNKVNASLERSAALYAEQEEKINEHTDNRERTKASLKESFDEEMGNLKEARARLRQVESEKAFHNKRGTTRRPAAQVVPKEKLQQSRQRRIDDAEGRTTVEVERMNSELANLMEECKVLKKQLDDVQAQQNKKREALETTLQETVDEGTDAREFKEKLEKEKEELTNLKADLQGVLHYVRAKNREEDEF